MKKLGFIALGAGLLLGATAPSASAIAPFKTEFEELYIIDGGTPEQTKLAEAYADKEAGACFACHANPKSLDLSPKYGKLIRNNYGLALSQLLKKENFSAERRQSDPDAVKAEIQDALKKVAEMKSNPDDPTSPTFGDLLGKGQLPSDGTVHPAELEKVTNELKAAGKL